MVYCPTVRPYSDFNSLQDAAAIKQACKGFGTDEDAIIAILTKRCNCQRREIATQFKTMYGKDLIDELKSEFRGNFEDVIVSLMSHPVELHAKELHKALAGIGTNEDVLIEILAGHNNNEIRAITQQYEDMYGHSLEHDIGSDTSGCLRKLLISLSTANRDETENVNQESAFLDAQSLLRAGETIIGTDESTFAEIMGQRSRSQLRAIFDEYQTITGHGIEQAIENEFSGSLQKALLDLIAAVRDKIAYFAKRLHDSMDGFGTNDRTLIRIVVSRSELDLAAIKEAFENLYGKTLAECVQDDTSGDYKKCLLSIIG